MDERRLADVRAGSQERAECCGSGYLVSPDVVLTAGHVLLDANGRAWPRIEVRVGHPRDGAPITLGASICWHGYGSDGTGLDVALLRLERPIGAVGGDGSEVRWGRPIGRGLLEYQGVGYPRFADYGDQARGVEQLRGVLPPLGVGVDGGFVLDQGAAPRAVKGERAWSGVSGAAVFSGVLLVGVVIRDDEDFENRRLHAVPTTRFAADKGFAAALRAPVVEPVELADLLDTRMLPVAAGTPASLLAAGVEAVDFHGREDTLEQLDSWRDGGAAGLSVLLLTGEGGAGKSRTARHFARLSRGAGWAAGLIEAARAVDHATAGRLLDSEEQRVRGARLAHQLAGCTVPVLVVCDYAEANPSFVATLLGDLVEQRGAHKARVLLLARTAAAWWQDIQALLGHDAISVALGPLAPGNARVQVYAKMVAALSTQLDTLPQRPIDHEPVAPWSVLAERLATSPPQLPASGNALTIAMTALIDLLEAATAASVASGEPPEQRLVEHEREYLRRAAAAAGLLERGVVSPATEPARRGREAMRALDRAVAGLILLGPCDRTLAAQVGALASRKHGNDVAHWLAALYPPEPDRGLMVAQVQPDRLAEHLLGSILTEREGGVLIHPELVLDVGEQVRGMSSAMSALFALVRTASHQRFRATVGEAVIRLVAQAPDSFAPAAALLAALPTYRPLLLDGLRRLGDLGTDALRNAVGSLRETSVSQAFAAAALSETAVELFTSLAKKDPYTHTPSLAGYLLNHAVRLSAVGRRAEAVAINEHAIALLRDLAKASPDEYTADLARSLHNHASLLAETGRWTEAAPVSEEALRIRRALAAVDPNDYVPDLAATLTNHAQRVAGVGRAGEALTLSEEAVDLYRSLADVNPEAYNPALATALSTHAIRLAKTGRQGEAVTLGEEALRLRRGLAEVDSDAYIPDLAIALINHAQQLAEMGRADEALTLSEEAVNLCRSLAEVNPYAYAPSLAAALTNHASRLTGLGRPTEALALSEEALDLYRSLATVNPDAYTPNLVRSLGIRGGVLLESSKLREAVTHFIEGHSLAEILPEWEQHLVRAHATLLRMAYEANPGEVQDQFRAITGQDPPDWMTQPS